MGLFDKLKDVNEMRKEASRIQAMLSQELITGGDKIKITVDGNQDVKSVEVNDSIVGDRGEIARQVRKAWEDIQGKHKKMLQSRFGSFMQQ